MLRPSLRRVVRGKMLCLTIRLLVPSRPEKLLLRSLFKETNDVVKTNCGSSGVNCISSSNVSYMLISLYELVHEIIQEIERI